MKMPEIGEFVQEVGSPYAENTVTGEEIVFFEDEDSNLIIRSMLEEDVDELSKLKKFTNRERKNLMKNLQKRESENCNFVIVESNICDSKGNRKIFAMAKLEPNENMNVVVFLKNPGNISAYDIAKRCAITRINSLMTKFYEITGANGEVIVERAG